MHAPVKTRPSLENGDRLTSEEFLSRWEQRPDIRHAQLVDGTVFIMASPVSADHGRPHAAIVQWLGFYNAVTPGLDTLDNVTFRVDDETVVQPDVAFLFPPNVGGTAHIGDDGYLHGQPELIVEIANSSVSLDLNRKRDAYLRAGVQEYLVWRVEDEAIDWWHLDGEQFAPIERDADGRRHSTVFPGLVLDDGLLFNRDFAGLMKLIGNECKSNPAHGDLVRRVNSSRNQGG